MPDRGFLSIDGDDVSDLIGDLKSVERDLGREQRKANRQVAVTVAGWAQSNARRGNRAQRRAAGAIRPASTQNTARLRLAATGATAGANAVFFGSNRRTGWYASLRYQGSAGRQFPAHVGNSWIAGGPGGPYVLNPTIRQHMPEIEDLYLDAHERAFRAAIPRG